MNTNKIIIDKNVIKNEIKSIVKELLSSGEIKLLYEANCFDAYAGDYPIKVVIDDEVIKA